MMKKMYKKPLAIILVILLLMTCFPQISSAEDGEKKSSNGVITGFAPLEKDEYSFEGEPTAEQLTEGLPETMDVFLDGSQEAVAIPVSWQPVEDYEDTDFYYYSLKPVWSDQYTLSEDLNELWDVPWITLFKLEPEEEEVEQIVEEEDAQLIYTEEEGAIEAEGKSTADSVSGIIKKVLGSEVYAGTQTNTDKIYQYLTDSMGLNKAAACGVMANIYAESGMSPINLENTYNTLLGLSDEEYTDRVDAGKGEYTTDSGERRNFKTDSCGYGLCQWTSFGRKTNLLEMVLDENVSIGDIETQLKYLEYELENSYPQVYVTLKNVPNNAQGVFLAASEFCLAFEVPANTYATSLSRGKTALTTYWSDYGGSLPSSSESFLGICGYTYPVSVKEGDGIAVSGYAISNYEITSIKAEIVDKDTDKVLYSKAASPNANIYNLSNFDDAIKFSALDKGNYSYILSAVDKQGKCIYKSHDFKVDASENVKRGVLIKDEREEQNGNEADASKTYSITFELDGGVINSGIITEYTYGTEVVLPEDVKKDGYRFEGWYTNPNFDGAAVTKINKTETGNKTYYAKWEKMSAPTITSNNLPDGEVGSEYSYALEATGDGSIKWSIESGELPDGLELSNNIIEGTPVKKGESNFQIRASNGIGEDDYKSFTITINEKQSNQEEGENDSESGSADSEGQTQWESVMDELGQLQNGNTTTVQLEYGSALPKEILDVIAKKDITLELVVNNTYKWLVDGAELELSSDTIPDLIDFYIGEGTIPQSKLDALEGDPVFDFSIAHDGEFGFTALLSINLGQELAGKWANIYYYNEDEELEFVDSAKIDENGYAEIPFEHASQYALAVDEEKHTASIAGTVNDGQSSNIQQQNETDSNHAGLQNKDDSTEAIANAEENAQKMSAYGVNSADKAVTTGDNTNIFPWIVVMLITLAVLIMVALSGRKCLYRKK